MQHGFSFGGQDFILAGEAALFWPRHRALLVADLHLEKASAYAAYGQMLPPYDSVATLEILSSLVEDHAVEMVICLGDNFHDDDGEQRLEGAAALRLRDLTSRVDWQWIVGNHDPKLAATWGGRATAELQISGIDLRHEALPQTRDPEISGHFHPKFRQRLRGRMVSRRCFVRTGSKLIMPAFGAFTGGMDAADPAILKACGITGNDVICAMVPTSSGVAQFSLCP